MYTYSVGKVVMFADFLRNAKTNIRPYDGEPIHSVWRRNLQTLGFPINEQFIVDGIETLPQSAIDKGSAEHRQILSLRKISDGVVMTQSVSASWVTCILSLPNAA
ncbi:MAG: hypothetical protein RI996_491 [Candidatus Parcubacteria bacterium]|jgi:hypothetical protein